MIIDDTIVLDDDDKPIKGGKDDGDWTMQHACWFVLAKSRVGADGRPAATEELTTRGRIARRIKRGQEIDATEVAKVRECLGYHGLPADFVYSVSDYLDTLVVGSKKKE